MQRREYYDQRELAAMFPDKYMCLIIDGSDQDTSRLPHLSVSTSPPPPSCPSAAPVPP